jgi:pyruvate dehydrogenase E2 component (dihydrolipoamide acetyltransferase)
MPHSVTVPQFGQTVEEATVVRWLKNVGDPVAKGDILFEIETDKAVLEVESFFKGTLLKILVKAGEMTPVQTVACFIGEPGEAIPEVAPPAPKAVAKKAVPAEAAAPTKTTRTSAPSAVPDAVVSRPMAPALEPVRFKISPRAAKLARDRVINPTSIAGTGPGGRVVERDIVAHLDAQGYDRLRITPSAKGLASREDLDVLNLEGSGHNGKILLVDVQRAVAEKPKPMSKMRQIIAQRLTESYQSSPHFFVTVAADLTDLLAFRQECKARGMALSVTDFIMKSVVLALEEFPEVNSSTDGKSVSWHSHVNLGLAVALDSGLVVPVIRCAEELALAELHDEATALTAKARDAKLSPDEMTGSTFTISNMGMLNVENFTAIINPGESAILAVSSAVKKAVVRDDKIVVRSIMKMTLSSDHRIIDGATAAKFANAIREKLEDVTFWKENING